MGGCHSSKTVAASFGCSLSSVQKDPLPCHWKTKEPLQRLGRSSSLAKGLTPMTA